jgi:hypothetical protein
MQKTILADTNPIKYLHDCLEQPAPVSRVATLQVSRPTGNMARWRIFRSTYVAIMLLAPDSTGDRDRLTQQISNLLQSSYKINADMVTSTTALATELS